MQCPIRNKSHLLGTRHFRGSTPKVRHPSLIFQVGSVTPTLDSESRATQLPQLPRVARRDNPFRDFSQIRGLTTT